MSMLTVCTFAIERYLAIHHPFTFNASSGVNRAIKVICGCWAFYFIVSSPLLLQLHVKKYSLWSIESDDFWLCKYEKDYDHLIVYLRAGIILLVVYLVPLTVTMLLYVRMWIKIRNSSKNSSSLVAVENIQTTERLRDSTRILYKFWLSAYGGFTYYMALFSVIFDLPLPLVTICYISVNLPSKCYMTLKLTFLLFFNMKPKCNLI